MLRDIICIDEAKCTGCGACLANCAENALAIVNGKARLVKDTYCDGLGACLGACPEGALTIVRREAAAFDAASIPAHAETGEARSCPGSQPRPLQPLGKRRAAPFARQAGSPLRHWPIQLRLMPADAPFLRGAHLLLAADCAGFAAPGLNGLLVGRELLIACPKLDDVQSAGAKLAEICRRARPGAITILRMSVPCCGGLERLTAAALKESGLDIPVHVEIIGMD